MQMKAILLTTFCLITTSAYAITPGIEGHAKGDVIAVRTDNQIATWCDFNKQILNTQINTLCVYNGNKTQL